MIKNLMIVFILSFVLPNEVMAKEIVTQKNGVAKNAIEEEPNFQKIPDTLGKEPKDFGSKDHLGYPLDLKDSPKPNAKFYSNKEFKGKPTAELKDDGLYIHDKKVCQWRKDYSEHIDVRAMYPVGKPRNSCIENGLMYSWIGHQGGGAFHIMVDVTTPEYYEIISNNEKFYINPKELKGFVFVESEKKKNEKKMAEFQKFLKDNPSLEKFINEKRQCIAKKDIKCLIPIEWDRQRIIREWLSDVCKVIIKGTTDLCNALNVEDKEPTFENELEQAFWNGAATCFPEDLSKYKVDRVSDKYIAFNMDKEYVGECLIRMSIEKSWEIEVGFNAPD